jgi:protein TonB
MAGINKIIATVVLCAFFSIAASAQNGPPVVSDDTVYYSASLNVVPEYPGGVKAFYSYLSNNFRMPEIDSTFTARILVSFVVEKDGTMSAIRVLRDPGFGLGAEALRVLQNVPEKWSPGEQNGRKIRASYNLPISLNFEETPKEKKKSNK